MSDVVLVLGPVAFGAFEVPERIVFGGAQSLAVHRLPGGARVIDALGRDDAELIWSGVFTGPDAAERARLLDGLRVQGAALPLTWDVLFYSVAIADFAAEYRNPFWIPYRLRCTVLRDESDAVLGAATDLAVHVSADLADAAAVAGGVDLAAAQAAVAAPGAVTLGSAAYVQAVASVAAARAGVGDGIASAGARLDGAALNSAAGLGASVAASGDLAGLVVANGFLGRAAGNLRNAGG